MLEYLRDQFASARLRARYRRIVQERLLELAESGSRPLDDEDAGDWQLLGGTKGVAGEHARTDLRDRARNMVRENPHACNILRLLESYVAGPGLEPAHQLRSADPDEAGEALCVEADRLWKDFLQGNCRHFSYRELARRTWRDGECFLRMYPSESETESWPPAVRFVDPELIGSPAGSETAHGILTSPSDSETPRAYLRIDPRTSALAEEIPADEILHARLNVDSNEPRGVSFFAPLLEPLRCYAKWLETEMLARKLQSSIVLWRRVQGGPGLAESVADRASDAGGIGRHGRRERFAPGSILTTNQGTEIQFLQPHTNFGDAVPLGRMLLLSVAAGAGLPEFMLTADAANANFASTLMAEGPAVKFFESQQQFFASEFTRLWRKVMQAAIGQQLLPPDFFDRVGVRWTFPPLVNRDRSQERLADVKLIAAGVLSRAEVGRRDGVDPELMRREREAE